MKWYGTTAGLGLTIDERITWNDGEESLHSNVDTGGRAEEGGCEEAKNLHSAVQGRKEHAYYSSLYVLNLPGRTDS